jgi:cell division protein FtsI (penicillin-binding protein 3)
LLAVFLLVFGLITWKLVSIQVFGKDYRKIGTASVTPVTLQGLRGSILAYNGDEMALTEMRETIFADPTEITDPAVEAGKLAGVLGVSAFTVESEITEKTTHVVLRAGASPTLADKVTALDLDGIGIDQAPQRYYPDNELASPLLGDINAAGQGVGGIEQYENGVLDGKNGELVEQVDPEGQPIAGTVTKDVPAENGENVLTTINPALQYQAEQALKTGIHTSKSEGGVVIVMDTKTGAVLACANMVADGKRVVQAQSVSAFTQTYNPGSVAKIITVAAGLALHKITPSSVISTPADLDFDGIELGDDGLPTSSMTPTGVLAQSSDTGAANIAAMFGAQEQYDYLKAFGVTAKTDINWPGESPGLVLTPSEYTDTTLPTVAYGDGYSSTAMQMISAVNTIANGGVYVAPKLVSAIVNAKDQERLVSTPAPHRVVPAWVTREMTPMLEQVVSSGTGTGAQIAGYAVAGKTGTAATYNANGSVNNSINDSSFVGYAPAKNPTLTTLVVMYHTSLYGAQASAPVFQTVMKDGLIDLNVPSDGTQPAPVSTAYPIIDGQADTGY